MRFPLLAAAAVVLTVAAPILHAADPTPLKALPAIDPAAVLGHVKTLASDAFEGRAPGYVEFVEQLDSRMHLVPRYRQKLAFPPLTQARPVWIDDPHFNPGYHVRHTALPEPASLEQLRNLAGRVLAQRLDRGKPLWEIWLVDNVEGGRFAMVTKTHHLSLIHI